jgi:Calcineurin-like phosphoesterase
MRARLRRRTSPAPGVAEFAPPVPAGMPEAPPRFRPAPGWLPAGHRIYAIGDVHGCPLALARLFAVIRADLAARPIARAEVVLLGDYIDYGPDSAGVLAALAGTALLPGATVIALRGDHEQMLLDALAGDAPAATDWLEAGGQTSLASWGIPAGTPRSAWNPLLPPAHLAFLRGLGLSHRAGGYLFVHAGLRPGVPLARQRRDDILAIRQPFLSEPADFGAVIVHGHSASPAPTVAADRIGLDTGAGLGGALTCAILEEDRLALISVVTDQGAPR